MIQSDEILVERAEGVVTVTINRPQRKNAVPQALWTDLRDVFEDIAGRTADRVMVITGAGDNFCSGADIGPGRDSQAYPLDSMRDVGDAALALHRMPKPTIARVDGVAVGAGMNLALGCDLVVASERARFCQIFVKRAMSVDFGGSWLLPRLVGLQKAKEMILLGEMMTAPDLERLGLVNRVVPVEQLDEAVAEWTKRLVAGPRLALSLSKTLLNKSFEVSLDQALEAESQAQTVNLTGPDIREAITAFAEKRDPVFRP
jgi:enoyl-CoA hydratase/carnithine racemase